jgi:AraC-like DNA-binding protein
LIHPDDWAQHASKRAQLLAEEIESYYVDQRLRRKGGEWIWTHSAITLTHGEAGDERWLVVSIQGIAEEKFVEWQIATADDIARLMKWRSSADSRKSGTGVRVRFEYPRHSLEGRAIDEILRFVHPQDKANVERTIKSSLATGASYSHEYRSVLPDGNVLWLRTTAMPRLDSAGRVTHLVGDTIDVTHTKARKSNDDVPGPIREILNHIEANWNQPIYLREMAKRYCISARAIQRYFATHESMTLTQYVAGIRLRHARHLLCNPTKQTTVTGVAFLCGFLNPGHFSREYRDRFGELPSETLRAAVSKRDHC